MHLDTPDETAAISELIERYVRCYGPVTESDIARWTGLPRATVRTTVASSSTLVPADVDGLDAGFLMHAAEVDASAAVCVPEDDVFLLPPLDPYLQSHPDRNRYVDAAHLPYVVDRGGNATSTILVRGRVVGVWDYLDKPVPEMRLLFFDPPRTGVRRQARSAATELGTFLGGGEPAAVECEHMRPLIGDTGAFLSPFRRGLTDTTGQRRRSVDRAATSS